MKARVSIWANVKILDAASGTQAIAGRPSVQVPATVVKLALVV